MTPAPTTETKHDDIWPVRLTLRDTKVFADEGQRIFTTATGYGYEKRDYVRADLVAQSDDAATQASCLERIVPSDDLVDAIRIAVNACGDVTSLGRFSKAVDPVRWVAGLQKHLSDALHSYAALAKAVQS